MDENELVIYGFQLGNSDPDFQSFVRSLTNTEIHDLRMILYKSMLAPYQSGGVAVGLYGKDRYGLVAVPESKKHELWEESGKRLFSYIKDLWTSLKTGLKSGSSMNPIKSTMWKVTRARAVTSHQEGLEVVFSTAIEVGLQYIGMKIMPKFGRFSNNRLSQIEVYNLNKTNPQKLLKREYFKIHPGITHKGRYGNARKLWKGQEDAGHRASTFFSTEVMQSGRFGIKDYRTIYFNKTIENRDFSVAINPWNRTIFHEAPQIYK